MGITIIQKSDLVGTQTECEGRAGAGGRRGHRRRVQARWAEGPRRLARQPQDDRLRHLRRTVRGRVPRRAARRGDHPGGDDPQPRRRLGQVHEFRATRLLQSESARVLRASRSEYFLDLATFVPGSILDLVAATPKLAEDLREPLSGYVRRPTLSNLTRLLTPIARAASARASSRSRSTTCPPGLFDNSTLETLSAARTSSDNEMSNDFRVLYRARRNELFIVAMNLDTAERVVFGHDEDSSLTISAVGAGLDGPARLLQAGAHPRHRLRRRRRAPHREHRRRHRARRGARHLLQPVPPVLQPRDSHAPPPKAATCRRRAAGRAGHTHGAEPGVPHAASLAAAARTARVPGRPELPGRHHRHRAAGERPRVFPA